MQIQKITNSKIKVIVNLKTIDKIFSSSEININNLTDNYFINKLFYKILLQAQKYYNFKINNYDLILQDIDMSDDNIIFILIKIPKYILSTTSKKIYYRTKFIKKEKEYCNLNLYKFKSCDLFLDFCNNIKNIDIIENLNSNKKQQFKIIFFNNTYFLLFDKFDKFHKNIYLYNFLDILSIYSNNIYCSNIYISKVLEHGKVLFTSNKFQKYIQSI